MFDEDNRGKPFQADPEYVFTRPAVQGAWEHSRKVAREFTAESEKAEREQAPKVVEVTGFRMNINPKDPRE